MPNTIPPAPTSPVTSSSLGFHGDHKSTSDPESPRGIKRSFRGGESPGQDSVRFRARAKRESSSASETGTQTPETEKEDGSIPLRNALKKALSSENEAAALTELESDLPKIFAKYVYFKITPGYLPRAMQNVLYKAMQKLPCNCKELHICLNPHRGKDLVGRHLADMYTIKEHSLAIREVDESKHDDLKIFVDYSNCYFGDEELEEAIQPLSGHSKIAYLDLSEQKRISSRGVKAIEKLVAKRGRLQEVDLTYCELDDEADEAIAELLKHPGVDIKLFYNNLGPKTARALAKAMTKPDFQRTDINFSCDIYEDLGDEEAKLIAQALKQCKVDTVEIGGKGITGTGVLSFAGAIRHRNSKLKSLILARVSITNPSPFLILMSSIADRNSVLESFMLRDVELSDAHIPSLIRTITSPKCPLKHLILSMKDVSDEKAQELREAIDGSNSSVEAYCLRNFGSGKEVLIKGKETLKLKFPSYF